MIKEFDENKSYVFSRERYAESAKVVAESNGREWYDRVNGVKVEVNSINTGKCWDMLVVPEWCEEANTEPKVTLKVSQKDLSLIIKSLDYLNNNNYFIEESESELVEKLIKELNKKSKEKY